MVQTIEISGNRFKRGLLALCCLAFSALASDRPPGAEEAAPSAEEKRVRRDAGLDSGTVYQLLLAEIAMQRGDIATASAEYAALALRTRDPAVMDRAIVVASMAKRFAVARDIADLWLTVDPQSERAYELMTRLKIYNGQLDGVAPILIRLFQQSKEPLSAKLAGLHRMLAGQPDQRAVFRLIEEVGGAFPDSADARYSVALAALSAGDIDRALEEAREAQRLRPEWEAPVRFEAQLLSQQKSKDASIDFLKQYLAEHPDARGIRRMLARFLLAQDRYPEAREHFEALAQTSPNDPSIVLPLGLIGIQQEEFATAEVYLKHLVTLPGSDKNLVHYYLGFLAERKKRIDEAIDHYAEVARGDSFSAAQFRRIRLLVSRGRVGEAKKLVAGLNAKTEDEFLQIGFIKADFLRHAKQYKAALDLLDGFLERRADNVELLYETAHLAEKAGRMDVFEARLRKLIALRPNNAQAYNALAYAFADRNIRIPEARELIDKALSLSQESHILDSMGWVLFRQGDLPEALTYLERARQGMDDPEISAHIGEVLWALGRNDEARQTLLDAQKRFPDSEVLRETIKRILH